MKRIAEKNWKRKNREKIRVYMKVYHKAWRDRNKDRVKLYASRVTKEAKHRSYLRNLEKHCQRAKEYYQQNKERIKERTRKWAAANKERHRETKRLYREKNAKALAAKQLARYHEIKAYMVEWRKKNAAKLKEQRQRTYWTYRETYLARQRERNRKMDQEKRKARSRMYRLRQKHKQMAAELSLLSIALAQKCKS